MITNYIKAKEIVKQKYNENDPYYPMLVVVLYGLLNKYQEHNLIKDLFLKTDIYIESGEINEILKRHEIEAEIEEDSLYTTYGGSNQGNLVYQDEKGNITFEKENPYIVCTNNVSNEDLLNTFCHELNHLIKGEINGFHFEKTENGMNYSLRTGLAVYYYEYKKEQDEIEYEVYNEYLDEAINSIQTTEIITDAYSLKDWIEDERIIQYLNSLEESKIKKDIGYHEITPIVRKIWNNESFKELIERNIVIGNLKKIEKEFDQNTFEGAFLKLAKYIDTIDKLIEINTRNKNLNKIQNKVQNIIDLYNSKTKFILQKKQNMIK